MGNERPRQEESSTTTEALAEGLDVAAEIGLEAAGGFLEGLLEVVGGFLGSLF